jgi:SOS response regulatory protein OraA/RecX
MKNNLPSSDNNSEKLKRKEGIRARALGLISKREWTEKILREKLLGIFDLPGDAEMVEEMMAEMVELDLVNDDRFARAYARHLWVGTAKSPRQISNALYEKGISSDVSAVIIRKEITPEEVLVKVKKELRKKLKGESFTKAQVQKAQQSLMRKGYRWSEVEDGIAGLG